MNSTSTVVWALLLSAFWVGSSLAQQEPADLVWSSPSDDANGSMPLGNGAIGLNAWIEPTGDLVFYISRGDAWGDNGRLLKIGRVRVKMDPAPDMTTFQQRLVLNEGTLKARFGDGDESTQLEVWVDAHRPVVHVTIDAAENCRATASIETWRNKRTPYPRGECSDLMEDRSRPNSLHQNIWVEPDVIMNNLRGRVGWYHRNKKSVGPSVIAKTQGLSDFLSDKPDPLMHRTFGAVISTPNGKRMGKAHLQTTLGQSHAFTVAVLTKENTSVVNWRRAVEVVLDEADTVPILDRKTAHNKWWRAFWERSHIHIEATTRPSLIPANSHDVRVGVDQDGSNSFQGDIAGVGIWRSALDEESLLASSSTHPTDSVPSADSAAATQAKGVAGPIGGSKDWEFDAGLTVTAWLLPQAGSGGRIVDKISPGNSNGFLFDSHPGLGLRFILGGHTLTVRNVLDAGKWTHVAAVLDPEHRRMTLRVSGNVVAEKELENISDATVVSRAYELQRFVDACAGRGRYPIKFNGSLFTVEQGKHFGGADYRRWGPGYWWQNTRLPYLSMCASGDTEMMKPLFQMYSDDLLQLHKYRTKAQTGHGGAFIPECIYFWGPQFSSVYGWNPLEERSTDRLQQSQWHKREWVAGLELVWMMLDYYEHTSDEPFLKQTLVPTAREVLKFFDEHYDVDASGKLHMHPAQSLEVWWDATNPMPELSGLHAVTKRLLSLPDQTATDLDRAAWRELKGKLPDLPTRKVGAVEMLAPARIFKNKRNVENPELYAVFPFRLVSFEKPNASLGINALRHRWDKGAFGWRQDDLFMAYLGLADEARTFLVKRARGKHAGSRFPAFWGPNYDWIPDQDHGGVLMRTLQVMLMQTDGRTIHLLPAWPTDWNANFRLHAPYGTTVEGEVKDGKIANLVVTPPARLADVQVHN